MRVLLYTPNYLPSTRYGGPVQSCHGLARTLVEMGHEVDVVTSNLDGADFLDVPLDKTVKLDGVSVRYFPITLPKRLYRAPMLARSVAARIEQYDVVHINGCFLWPGPVVAGIAKRACKPLIVTPRGMLVSELIAARSTVAKKIWISFFERRVLRRAAALHVTTEREAEDIRALGLDLSPIHVIPNAVDVPPHTPKLETQDIHWQRIPRGQRIAFLGRIDWKKGVDLAVDAVGQLPNADLLIAGYDQMGLVAKLKQRVAESRYPGETQFIGPVEGDAKWAFLAGADVVLVPSIHENFGIVVAEALAVGIPVVCTERVGAATIVKRLEPDAVVPRTADALAAAIACLLADPARRSTFGARGRALVKKEFTWPMIADRMSELYDSVNATANENRRILS